MKFQINYWYHSCFTIRSDDTVLLFDYPGRGMNTSLDEKIKNIVKGKELYVFISHAHGDHFSPEVVKFAAPAAKTHIMISSDVSKERIVSRVSDPADSVTFTSVEPDSRYKIEDLSVTTFESNDAGVAFLLEIYDYTIYYGGDLAKWNWPEWDQEKVREHVRVFEDIKRELKKEDIDIAFSNMDERLPSWAGPIELIEEVNPRYFVPMHTFGNEEWINDLVKEEIKADSEIFHYKKSGDEFNCEL
ncbi:MAG: MBL fold metallo-hydrolase [Candidatus Thermoplasmatota archaeon]|nr:MBL fold metallo-hydrolase [Candidatus Thermoplasmatota archaeon]